MERSKIGGAFGRMQLALWLNSALMGHGDAHNTCGFVSKIIGALDSDSVNAAGAPARTLATEVQGEIAGNFPVGSTGLVAADGNDF